MMPSASRYAAALDLRNINDSHVVAVGRVPARSRVLDLGTADGSVAALLRGMGCRIWGVEIDPAAAEAARAVCEEVAVDDLNQLDLATRFEGIRFDVVLMLDVLEHLADPAAVLARVGSVLADGGWGVISLPNVAHASVRLALLEGRFSYMDTGLLDRTHLRFFDRAGVEDLLRQAGWGMFEMVRLISPLGSTEIQVSNPDPVLVRQLASDIEALTYQFVLCAAPLGSVALEHNPVLPAAIAQAAYLELQEQVRTSTVDARLLSDVLERLATIRQASMDRRLQLRDLLATVEADMEQLRARASD